MKQIAVLVALIALMGAAHAAPSLSMPSQQLDSQIVLERYELEMADIATPKAVIYAYTVSQLGPATLEQRHRIYRSGLKVRDETLSSESTLTSKAVRISQHDDRYAIEHLAPRNSSYTFLFLRAHKHGSSFDYEFEVTPFVASARGFSVERVTIDGRRFLPSVIAFRTSSARAHGTGAIQYGAFGRYWMPLAVTIDASVGGAAAREHIAWSEYRFPADLPSSTFQLPKRLPEATPAPF